MTDSFHASGTDHGHDDIDFKTMMGDVQPLRRSQNRADAGHRPAAPTESQIARRRHALSGNDGADGLSDDFVDLVPPYDPLEFRRDGIQIGVMERLRQGGYPVQASLHLLRRPLYECRASLPQFIRDAYAADLRSVLIVHGAAERSMARPMCCDPVSPSGYLRWRRFTPLFLRKRGMGDWALPG